MTHQVLLRNKVTHLISSGVGLKLQPTMLPREVNQVLERMGFQVQEVSGKKKRWQLTEQGKGYGFVYFATNEDKWSGDQIRWQVSVVEEVQGYLLRDVA